MAVHAQATQRVKKLHKEFMHYHNQGYSVMEIAKIFDVDFSTVYKHLQQIADENGVTRESLLSNPVGSYPSRATSSSEKVDFEKLRTDFDNAEKSIDEILNTIKKFTTKE